MNRRGAHISLAAALCLATACGADSPGQDAGTRDPQLEAMVEKLVPRVEELAHLQARWVPAVRRSSVTALEAYLLDRLEAEYPGDTLESVAAAYRAFGLLPDTVDLRELLIGLLLEQAIGYYDPTRDVLFVREEAPEPLLEAVVLHELVHAVQDQYIDLDSLIQATPTNDRRTAIQSAMEGQATAAMMAFQLEQMSGQSTAVDRLPELGPEMADALAASSQYPRLATAPRIVREPLLFAYLGGVRFVQRLWRAQPDHPPPFGRWLPESTEQLIHTERLLEDRDSPTRLEIGTAPEGWQVRYGRDLGELELRIFLEEHLDDPEQARRAAAGWDGDAYALLMSGDNEALVWYTAWDSEADAHEFVAAYGEVFRNRFGGEGFESSERRARVDRLMVGGLPVIRIVELPPAVNLEPPPGVRVETVKD